MKSIILFLLLSAMVSFGQVMTNGSFAVIKGNTDYELVAKGKARNTNQFVAGRTYEVGRESYFFGTNDESVLYFTHGLLGKVSKGTEFTINSFNQEVNNLADEPAKLKVGAHNFAATIMKGDAYFSFVGGNELSSCVISTPLVDVELNKGKFYFRVEEGGVMVFVLEGKAIGHGERGKKEECEAGRAIVAAPIKFQMKGLDDKVFLNTKKAKVDETKKLLIEASTLEKVPADFIFSVVNGKVVAVNIH